MLFVNCSTVSRWVKAFTSLHFETPASKKEMIVEPDEMRDFVEFKRDNGGFEKRIVKQLDNFLAGRFQTAVPHLLEKCFGE